MQTTSPPSSAPARPELRRPRADRVLLGVCSGLAHSFGISALWVRLAAIALLVVVPAPTILAYAVLCVVVARDDGRMALGGSPADSGETLAAWAVVLLAAYVAVVVEPSLLIVTAPPSVLLLAAALTAVAVFAAQRRGEAGTAAAPEAPSAAGEPTEVLPVLRDPEATARLPEADAPTEPLKPDRTDPPPAKPGPSLLLIGLAVLALPLLAPFLLLPPGAGVDAYTALVSGTAVFGGLALLGIVAAIAFSGRRHAAGLLVLSILVGLLALGMGALIDDASRLGDAESPVRWLADRVADLLRLNP